MEPFSWLAQILFLPTNGICTFVLLMVLCKTHTELEKNSNMTKMKGETHLGKVQLFPLKIGGHGVLLTSIKSLII